MFWKVLILAIVGGIIGWFTNYLAVKLIFRPLNPIEIPLFKIKIQGLIPKRRIEIARSIGEIIEKELLSINEILKNLITNDNKRSIIKSIRIKVLAVVEDKIPGLVPRPIREAILRYVGEVIEKESQEFLEQTIEDLIENATANIRIQDLVEEKLNQFDLLKLESIILSISHKELRYIEILGGILGTLIGLIQGLLIEVLKIGS